MKDDIAISVSNLSKVFKFPIKNRSNGFLKNLLNPDYKVITAVNDITINIKKGERIACIGPNGAGKSTFIKMLTGILYPTNGNINILGINPQTDSKRLAYKIGTVFGQRSQLLFNLPLIDSFFFFGNMYDMNDVAIKNRMDYLTEVFQLREFIDQPIRKLSLGQRMRAEIAVALIHSPEIIFLDEPTIGLDIVSKKSLRDLLLKINKDNNTTIFLTSHDVVDIETICERTIIINKGKIVIDSPTSLINNKYINHKYVDLYCVNLIDDIPPLPSGVKYISSTDNKVSLSIDISHNKISNIMSELLKIFDITNIDIYDVELEEIIREIYEDHK
ncbi:MAG: ATP-binding cassette domain-containing protein [Cyanobium sp. MAG06]|nr:ATP-binding cassette domain-containing protein [Cyanobium sp. MAG06]